MLSTTASMMSRAGRRVPEAPAAVRGGGMALLGRKVISFWQSGHDGFTYAAVRAGFRLAFSSA
jgi:hypothetical protein